jgi:hypothetical protein
MIVTYSLLIHIPLLFFRTLIHLFVKTFQHQTDKIYERQNNRETDEDRGIFEDRMT